MLSFDRYMVCFYFYYNDVKMQICKNNIYIVYNTNIYYIMETIFKKVEDGVKEHKEKQKENIKNSVFKKIKGFLDSNNIDTGIKANIGNEQVFVKIKKKLNDFKFSPFKSYDSISSIDNKRIDASNKLEGITDKLKKITNKLLDFDNDFYESALIRPVSNDIGFLKDKLIQIANTKLRDTLVERVNDERYEDDFETEPENQALLNNFKDNLIPIAVKTLKDILDKRREDINYQDEPFEKEEEDEDIIEEEIDYKDAFKENLKEIAKTNLKLLFNSNLNRIKDLKNALEDVVDVVKPSIKIGDIVVFKLNEEHNNGNEYRWYIGKITRVNDDGTYDINVGDNTYENVPSHSVVGVKDIIDCNAKYNGKPCKITGVKDDGTVTIKYDDGNLEENIIGDDIIIEETDILNILKNNIPGLSLLLHENAKRIDELTNMIVQLENANLEVIKNQQELEKVNKTLSENQQELKKVNEKLSEKQSELENANKESIEKQRELIDEIKRLESSQNNLRDYISRVNKIQNKLRDELINEVKYNEQILSDNISKMTDNIYKDLQRIIDDFDHAIMGNYAVMQNINDELKTELLNEIKNINTQYKNELNTQYNNEQYKKQPNRDTNNNPTQNIFTFNTTPVLNDIIQHLTIELNKLKEELEKSKKDRNTVLGYTLSTLASNKLKDKLASIVTNKNNLVNQNPRLKKQVELLLEAQTLVPHVLLSIYQQELKEKETELKQKETELKQKETELKQKETELKNAINENTKTKGENIKEKQLNNAQATEIKDLQHRMKELYKTISDLTKQLAEVEKEKSKNSLTNILKKIAMTNLISVFNKPTPIEDGDVVMTEYYNDNENKQNKIESIKVF